MVQNPFDPRTSGPRLPVPLDKWSPTNSVLMDKWSAKIWSPLTNGPQPIRSLYFLIPSYCPPGQTEYSGDHLSMGTKLVGDHLSMVTVCPKEPINWGPIVGNQKFGDYMRLGLNVSEPIKYFKNHMDSLKNCTLVWMPILKFKS